jgi:hypothetical protein
MVDVEEGCEEEDEEELVDFSTEKWLIKFRSMWCECSKSSNRRA